MANPNIGSIVNEAYEQAIRETPAPYDDSILSGHFRFSNLTYRERLDRQPRNRLGERIPRIVIVRHNLRRLKAGNTMRWRGLDVKDRRQQLERRCHAHPHD